MNLNRFIGDLRERTNLSRKDFAKTLSVSAPAVRHWETGRNGVSIPALKNILVAHKHHINVKETEYIHNYIEGIINENPQMEYQQGGVKRVRREGFRIGEHPDWMRDFNALGDNLSDVHPNDPRLVDLRRRAGYKPFMDESSDLVKDYIRKAEARAGVR